MVFEVGLQGVRIPCFTVSILQVNAKERDALLPEGFEEPSDHIANHRLCDSRSATSVRAEAGGCSYR